MQVELPLECIPQVVTPIQTPLVPQQLAIHLRDVNFVSSKKNVLSHVSLSVPRGSMYGLLGPSGCGKTVFIRCILGTLKPTSGSVKVYGHKPGRSHSVGYMPQHIALFPQLTIRETFNYFGSIYGIDGEQVNETCLSLVESLHLPTQTDQLVGLLSGDQKRRLSLAIALIHKPKLLILDEPTCGMDPLIRNFIWGHLIELVSLTDLTVLITSDCIEEAKNYANFIGFMRHGHILAQDSPSALMDRFQMINFDKEFLSLSTETSDNVNSSVEQFGEPEDSMKSSSSNVEVPEVIVDNVQQQPTEPIDESQMDSITDIQVVNKCTQMNTLEPGFLHLSTEAESTIGVLQSEEEEVNPSVEEVGTSEDSLKISSSGIESVPDLIVVVDSAQQHPTEPIDDSQMDSVTDIRMSQISKCTEIVAMVTKNIRTLYRNKSLMIFQLSLPTVLVALFCLYISTLQMHPKPVAVYDGDNPSLSSQLIYTLDPVIINQQYYPSWDEVFEAFRMSKAPSALAIEVNFSSCYYRYKPLYYIMGRSFTYLNYSVSSTCPMTLTSVYKEIIQKFPATIKKYWVIHPKFKQVPVLIEKPDRSSPNLTPGMISIISFFSVIPFTSITLFTEKKNGLIERTLVSGVSYFHILLSHLIPQTVILFLQMMSLVLVAFPLFGIPFHFQYLLAMSLLYLQSVCGMCLGLFVSTIARDWNMAIMFVLGLFHLNLLLNGTILSTEAMIDYVIAGGWSIHLFEVVCAFSVTLLWSGIFLLAATLIARFCL